MADEVSIPPPYEQWSAPPAGASGAGRHSHTQFGQALVEVLPMPQGLPLLRGPGQRLVGGGAHPLPAPVMAATKRSVLLGKCR